jgi:hypothetical protein
VIRRYRRLLRVGFVAYAAVLFIATHKPGVDVNVVPGWRLDLLIHMAAFGLWALLLGLTGWLANARHTRGMFLLMVVSVAYAAFDESTQALPIFDRVFDLTDMAANAMGAILGTVIACLGLHTLDRCEAGQP